MAIKFSRADNSIISKWWWSVDRQLLFSVLTLSVIGIFLNYSASPAIASRIGLSDYHFIYRHLFFLPISLIFMIAVSMLNVKWTIRVSLLVFILTLIALVLLPFIGSSAKGATRWFRIMSFTIQPSEFIKPTLLIVTAWLFDGEKNYTDFPGSKISFGVWGLVLFLLVIQPDIGMSIVVTSSFAVQLFLSGLPLWIVISAAGFFILGGIVAYYQLDHVHDRVNDFLSTDSVGYQVKRSFQAFENGGIWGTGPGEGIIKNRIPDAHTDFIFAVAGEEFGLIFCLLIFTLYVFIIYKILLKAYKSNNLFIILALTGLAIQFGLQSFINMASTVHLIPTKGMTLPFISYGGSSTLATALGMGYILGLSRKRIEQQ